MTLPNLFIAGATKCGTTTLYHHFNQHPEIFMSPVKEPRFFCCPSPNLENFRYPQDQKEYENLFQNVSNERLIGEATPAYMHSTEAIERIQKKIQAPKFIFSIRNPTDRAFSHYKMMYRKNIAGANFYHEFKKDIKRQSKIESSYLTGGIYGTGLYDHWLEKYIEAFGKENIYVMIFERWTKNPLAELNKCYSFLGVFEVRKINNLHHHKGTTFTNHLYNKTRERWQANQNKLLGKCLISTGLKDTIKYIGAKTLTQLPDITSEQRNIVSKDYQKNVANLRKILKDDLTEWSEDFPLFPPSGQD